MRSFNMGRFGSSDDPWFRVGTVDVSTTILVLGVSVFSILVWAVEGNNGPILGRLALIPSEVTRGQFWRLFTWPLANSLNSLWVLVLFLVFFQLGSQLEASMGRKVFAVYLALIAVIPAVIVMLFHILLGVEGAVAGLRMVELGVLVGFGLRVPSARFWPGIPAWGLAAGVVALNMLQFSANRNYFAMLFLVVIVVVALIALRSLGFADHAEWVPRVPLTAKSGGGPTQTKPRSTSKRKRRSRSHLSVAPAPRPNAVVSPRKELTKLEVAEMDSILDQVSEQGMDSLTPQQRQRLEDHSRRLRRRGD